MRVTVVSSSAPVARTLGATVTAAGHELCASDAEPELLLVDAISQPQAKPTSDAPRLTLVSIAEAEPESTLACPLTPERLIQKLSQWQRTRPIAFDAGWALDSAARQLVHPSSAAVSLTEKESALLHQLAKAAGQKISREALLEAVWGVGSEVDTHTLETHIYRLRSKLEALTPSPGDIITESGSYSLLIAQDSP